MADKHALAIAYEMRRRAMKKKMAEGGMVKNDQIAEPNKKNAEAMQKGATKSGYQPDTWMANLKEGLHMDEGGFVPSNSMEAYLEDEYKSMKDRVNKLPSRSHDEEPDAKPSHVAAARYAKGGLVDAIMKKRAGQSIDENDHEDSDEFLTADMDSEEANEELEHETYPDPDDTEHEIEPHEKRKRMLAGIMSELRSKHYGK